MQRYAYTSAMLIMLSVSLPTCESQSAPTATPSRAIEPVAIQLQTVPALPRATSTSGAEGLRAQVGSHIQVRAEVSYSDGSRRDVTTDSETVMVSLDEKTARVSKTGETVFLSTAGQPSAYAGVAVGYRKVGDVLNFVVVEREDRAQ